MCDTSRCNNIVTRSPKQYKNLDINISVSEDVGDLETNRKACVVFDDMLDTSENIKYPFFTRGRHHDCDVYYLSQSFSIYLNAPYGTILTLQF